MKVQKYIFFSSKFKVQGSKFKVQSSKFKVVTGFAGLDATPRIDRAPFVHTDHHCSRLRVSHCQADGDQFPPASIHAVVARVGLRGR